MSTSLNSASCSLRAEALSKRGSPRRPRPAREYVGERLPVPVARDAEHDPAFGRLVEAIQRVIAVAVVVELAGRGLVGVLDHDVGLHVGHGRIIVVMVS